MATSSQAGTASVRVRPATVADLPAVETLLLTSYRQFPLFSYLYAPLYKNLNWARDTRFFWHRQLRLTMLEPSTTLLVAETNKPLSVETEEGPAEDDASLPDDVRESWRMLRWTKGQNALEQPLPQEWQVCGWAVWMERPLGTNESKLSWADWFRAMWIIIELNVWKRLYRRRDQDHTRYQRYLESQDEIEAKYYGKPSYFLDNLCVDFRRQRIGIGAKMVEWGVAEARRLGLPASTEAGPKGEGLYRRFGFKEIGTWTVQAPDLEQKTFDMPVMRLDEP